MRDFRRIDLCRARERSLGFKFQAFRDDRSRVPEIRRPTSETLRASEIRKVKFNSQKRAEAQSISDLAKEIREQLVAYLRLCIFEIFNGLDQTSLKHAKNSNLHSGTRGAATQTWVASVTLRAIAIFVSRTSAIRIYYNVCIYTYVYVRLSRHSRGVALESEMCRVSPDRSGRWGS